MHSFSTSAKIVQGTATTIIFAAFSRPIFFARAPLHKFSATTPEEKYSYLGEIFSGRANS